MEHTDKYKNFVQEITSILQGLGFIKVNEENTFPFCADVLYRNGKAIYIELIYEIREGWIVIGFGRKWDLKKDSKNELDKNNKFRSYSLSGVYELFAKQLNIKCSYLDVYIESIGSLDDYFQNIISLIKTTLPDVLARCTIEDIILIENRFLGDRRQFLEIVVED